MATKYKHFDESKRKYHLLLLEPRELEEEFVGLARLSIFILKDLYALHCAPEKIERFRNALLFMVENNRRILSVMEHGSNTQRVQKILTYVEEST